jgi:pimeloyl-ACP methyl ester carboxylesterase
MYEHFHKLVPDADAVCLPDIGHYPQTEAPAAVLAELEAFL